MINTKTILNQCEEKELEVLNFILEQEEELGLVVVNDTECLEIPTAWEMFNNKVAAFKYADNNSNLLFVTLTSGELVTLAQI